MFTERCLHFGELLLLLSVGHLVQWMQAKTTARLVVGFLESLL